MKLGAEGGIDVSINQDWKTTDTRKQLERSAQYRTKAWWDSRTDTRYKVTVSFGIDLQVVEILGNRY